MPPPCANDTGISNRSGGALGEETMCHQISRLALLKIALATGAAAFPVAALAQNAQPVTASTPSAANAATDANTIIVTGFRASLNSAVNEKRESVTIIDSINAEDIADFPDANLAESIQRLPGVSIDRDNGEGRSITVRGLGGDFQSTRLNGIDALSVAGGNNSDSGANRSRGFDFNTFASELFSNITVHKTGSASEDEGSLGATIDLTTGRPLSYNRDRIALITEAEYRENGNTVNPRLAGLFATRLASNFGIMGSIAYQKSRSTVDSYRRQPGQFEYLYRNALHAGSSPAVYGFARPGTGPTGAYGSNPAAYALLSPTTIIPGLPNLQNQDLRYDRLGATLTMQWEPTEHTSIILDGVYSRYNQTNVSNQLMTIGLNRNGTNTRAEQRTLRAAGTTNGFADRRAVYVTCTQSATSDCGQTLNGTTLVPGTKFSFNPNNLDPYDYYNSPVSPGFGANPDGIYFYDQLLGRPGTQVMAAHVNDAGQADYLQLDNLDWRSAADSQQGKTLFKQASVTIRQDIGDRLHANLNVGYSQSKFSADGFLVEFNAVDQDGFVFDERDGGRMPIVNPGFDDANSANWSLVKGLSTIRAFQNSVSNDFKLARLNFDYELSDQFTLEFGGTVKEFGFSASQSRRAAAIEAINPTLSEAGLAITDLGTNINFGQSLKLTAGTPSSWYGPDLQKFKNAFGIDCNCINKWGDFRTIGDGRESNAVTERDKSAFVQLDFDLDLFGKPLRGNAGARYAHTEVAGTGSVGGSATSLGLPVTAINKYDDWLPSINLTYELSRNFLVRAAFAKVIARPQIQNLTPGTTSFSSSLSSNGSAPSVTVGNPYLSPFRATNYDLSFEYYVGNGGLFAVSLFYKDLASFPQQLAGEIPLSQVFDPATYATVLGNITNGPLNAYTAADGVWAVRQFRDAPGGTIKGVEINAQHDFGFLGDTFKNFGINANYTHITSNLNYLTGTSVAATQTGTTATASNSFSSAPFLNTSPDSFNATLYYENDRFSARISGAYRTRYVNRFPLSTGTCSVGLDTNGGAVCNSPVIADFGYVESRLNLDFSSSVKLSDIFKLSLEARNLTNSTDYRTMYRANPVSSQYAGSGRVVTVGLRAIF
ncbi:MAG: TonB-dependent receptor [Croceibacterium sp.]